MRIIAKPWAASASLSLLYAWSLGAGERWPLTTLPFLRMFAFGDDGAKSGVTSLSGYGGWLTDIEGLCAALPDLPALKTAFSTCWNNSSCENASDSSRDICLPPLDLLPK